MDLEVEEKEEVVVGAGLGAGVGVEDLEWEVGVEGPEAWERLGGIVGELLGDVLVGGWVVA